MNNARELEAMGLGAHLNILRGPPLSPVGEVPSLLNARGTFFGNFLTFYLRLITHQIRIAEVELEWSRQIEKLLGLGLRLTHLDSEQHTHCLPPLFPIIGRLALRYGIVWVRRPIELEQPGSPMIACAKARLLKRWLNKASALPSGISSADLVWGVIDQGPMFSCERLVSYLYQHRKAAIIEVICHPGLPRPGDAAVPADYGRLRVPRYWALEAQTMLSPNWITQITKSEFTLANFATV